MGVTAMDKAMRGGEIVASFPVEMDDQIMLGHLQGAVDPRACRRDLIPVALCGRGQGL